MEVLTIPPEQSSRRYLTCAETAKLARVALKKAFPGVKFSVRSDTYSMGASIRVNWTDGPTYDAVQHLCDRFCGSGFDGMIDLKFSNCHWLRSDGTLEFASTEGTEGSRGVYPRSTHLCNDPGAELVRLGADYVFASRELSDNASAYIVHRIEKATGQPYNPNHNYGSSNGNAFWGSMLFGQTAGEIDFREVVL